jgi:hypothetical protein
MKLVCGFFDDILVVQFLVTLCFTFVFVFQSALCLLMVRLAYDCSVVHVFVGNDISLHSPSLQALAAVRTSSERVLLLPSLAVHSYCNATPTRDSISRTPFFVLRGRALSHCNNAYFFVFEYQ